MAESKLKAANAKLAKAQGELDQVQSELDEMQRQFDEALAKKQELQDDADACTKKMDAANRLIGGLAGERKRWEEQSEAFDDEIRRLAGDVALACAFITYTGPVQRRVPQVPAGRTSSTADCLAKGCPSPRTSASRSSSSTRRPSATGTSRGCRRTTSRSRTASW